MIRVCVAGATGWAGRAIVDGILASDDLVLASGVARSGTGHDLGLALGGARLDVTLLATVPEAVAAGMDVLVEYTSHASVKANVMAALEAGVAVVVGSSGLTADDDEEIDALARRRSVGVIAAGNFSITAAMAQAAALLVAPFLPHAEIIDLAAAEKPDAPSGTARELAQRLGAIRAASTDPAGRVPAGGSGGSEADLARGLTVAGIPVHSVRLPSFSVSTEVIFGLPDERLTIRHDAGSSAAPYVAGTLLAVRLVGGRVGLTRGLDTLLLGSARTGPA
jgi:4-hydroxy-tetrahydrodipicolinate reductase